MNTNRRFLNYKEYDNFQQDLNDGKISEDTIVFIQDKRCIWARGKEYTGNLALDYNKESKIATLKTADGESIIDFVDKDEYTDFKSTFINFVTNEYAVFKNNTNTSLITVTDDLLAEINRSVLVDSDIDTRLAKEITNRQVSYDGLSHNIGRVERELLNNIENVNNDLTSTKETLNEVDNRVDSLENLIEADQDGIINKFNEIVSFLNNIGDEVALKSILDAIDTTIADIRSNYELKEDHNTDKQDIYNTIYNILSTVSNKADKSEIPTVPTNVSAFTNDSGYLVAADIADKANKADLATVATSGDYDDLINKPTIPAAQVQSDWGETSTGEPSFIKNKPTNVSAFTNDAGYLTSADIEGVGDVDERELNAKLKTLQEYLADQYVLKKDVQTPDTNVWSEATIYPFGELPESEIGETPMHTSIEAYREDVYNQLERDGAIRNDICYFIYKES